MVSMPCSTSSTRSWGTDLPVHETRRRVTQQGLRSGDRLDDAVVRRRDVDRVAADRAGALPQPREDVRRRVSRRRALLLRLEVRDLDEGTLRSVPGVHLHRRRRSRGERAGWRVRPDLTNLGAAAGEQREGRDEQPHGRPPSKREASPCPRAFAYMRRGLPQIRQVPCGSSRSRHQNICGQQVDASQQP